MSRAQVDLDHLNEAERRVLRLLAEGHTAKSIATAIDSTPAAVNERLREARRKTGVGSSRELARLLRAQENRHEQMGVAMGCPTEAGFPISDAEPWRPQTGVIAMIAFFLVSTAGAAVLMSLQPQAANESDPLFASIFAQQQDPMQIFASHPKSTEEMDRALAGAGYWAVMRQLHVKVHSEPRDAAWASMTENSLRKTLVSIPRVGVQGTELRVLCGSTLCEIAGTVDTPLETSGAAARDEFNRTTMSRLNPHALEPETDKLRLETMVGGIGTMSQDPPRLSYVFYYSRAQPAPR
jgi:DNA-binding CsgD family transcriptional regulator